jgi:cytidylate kinase
VTKNDKTRDLSPAVPADDAIFIDNTLFTPTDTLNEALKIINERVENMRKKERADNIESSTI